MANLKEIRDRIKSVKNTRKITEAMRLVAAAKVRRAQEQVLRSRPFADRLARILDLAALFEICYRHRAAGGVVPCRTDFDGGAECRVQTNNFNTTNNYCTRRH